MAIFDGGCFRPRTFDEPQPEALRAGRLVARVLDPLNTNTTGSKSRDIISTRHLEHGYRDAVAGIADGSERSTFTQLFQREVLTRLHEAQQTLDLRQAAARRASTGMLTSYNVFRMAKCLRQDVDVQNARRLLEVYSSLAQAIR